MKTDKAMKVHGTGHPVATFLWICLLYFWTSTHSLASPAIPGEACKVAPHHSWNRQEQWTWKQICEGREANLCEFAHGYAEPSKSECWPKARTLTPHFLEALLLFEPWRSSIPRQGARISHARFIEPIDLEGARLNSPLTLSESEIYSINLKRAKSELVNLEGSTVLKQTDLSESRMTGHLILINAKIKGKLEAEGIDIANNALFRGAQLEDVVLRGAHIGGQLVMEDTTVRGKLNMNAIQIGDCAVFSGAKLLDDVVLRGSRIGGQFIMDDAFVQKTLKMSNVQITADARFTKMDKNGAFFESILLAGVSIGGDLDFNGASINSLILQSLSVGASLLIENTKLPINKKTSLLYLSIENNLSLSGSQLGSLDLTGSQIKHALLLGLDSNRRPPVWANQAKLILRNVTAQAIQDREESDALCIEQAYSDCRKDAWPEKIELSGFKFSQLGALEVNPYSDLAKRTILWWKKWIGRQQVYSAEPYLVVATVLRDIGKTNMADSILHIGKNAEKDAAQFPQNILLWLSWAFIGYGYKKWLSLFWIAGFIGIGTWILWWSGEYKRITTSKTDSIAYWVDLIAYSLDMLLPIIKLREYHYTIDLAGAARFYFYFHRIMGWILGSFLVAGISGLTK